MLAPNAVDAASFPHLTGRHARLRPVRPDDYGLLYQVELSEQLGWRWRHRGTTPSPERYPATLWNGVQVQYIICTSSGQPVGLATTYQVDQRNGTAYLALVSFEPGSNTYAVTEGVGLFIEYVFRVFPFRKLYVEVVEFNDTQMHESMRRFFVEEGRLREQEFFDGRYWDVIILALWRDHWLAEGSNIAVRAAAPRASNGADVT